MQLYFDQYLANAFPLLVNQFLSFPRRRESIFTCTFQCVQGWIPAPAFAGGRLFAGMTRFCFSLVILLFLPQTLFAKDLGAIGTTYPIAETDFVQMAQAKLQHKIDNGDFARWQLQQSAELKSSADRPAAAPGLQPALQTRRWLFDPSFIVPSDIKDANGRLLLPAGASLNPLSTLHWSKTLLFFDSDHSEQVEWAVKQNQALNGKGLLILVNGSLHDTALHFPRQRIYFDQGGRLIHRLQITHVPAMVGQAGEQLQITEVKL